MQNYFKYVNLTIDNNIRENKEILKGLKLWDKKFANRSSLKFNLALSLEKIWLSIEVILINWFVISNQYTAGFPFTES